MNEQNRTIISGMRILFEKKWLTDHALVVENSKIKAVLPVEMIRHHLPARHLEFHADCMLIPGLIDLHMHGVHGHDVMDADETSLMKISRALAAEGMTGFLATTMTAENNRLESVLANVAATTPKVDGAAILGVHLEGPFIAKEKMGAQPGDYTQAPDLPLFSRWQTMANNGIKVVTLASELSGALPFIKALRKMGVTVSLGHTNATYDETMQAIQAGAAQATHLFNAMRGIHQREPGASGALLLSDDITAELIVDGVHLHPAVVLLAFRIKGKDRLLLVSDSMRAACLGDGNYELGGQTVTVQNGRATLPDGTLAGSTLRLPQAVCNLTKFTDCPLEDAIYMASYLPARILGLAARKGTIEIGKDADLVVLNTDFNVLYTMREGREIYKM